MLKYWLYRLLFAGTMFFASAAVDPGAGAGVTDNGGADPGGDPGSDPATDLDIDGGGDPSVDPDPDADPDLQEDKTGDQQHADETDKEASDFKGLVSKRLLALKKEAPELT